MLYFLALYLSSSSMHFSEGIMVNFLNTARFFGISTPCTLALRDFIFPLFYIRYQAWVDVELVMIITLRSFLLKADCIKSVMQESEFIRSIVNVQFSEYAFKAISNAGYMTIGLKGKDCAMILSQRKIPVINPE